MTESEVFCVERDGNVATLWLDSPERRNAMGPDFWNDLPVLMGELSDDDDVRAVVIAAKGPHFTVGLDLKTMGGVAAGGGGGGKRAAAARGRAVLQAGTRPRQAVTQRGPSR